MEDHTHRHHSRATTAKLVAAKAVGKGLMFGALQRQQQCPKLAHFHPTRRLNNPLLDYRLKPGLQHGTSATHLETPQHRQIFRIEGGGDAVAQGFGEAIVYLLTMVSR